MAFFNGTSGEAWALVNLICTILTVVFGGIATGAAAKIKRTKDELRYEDEDYTVLRREKKDGESTETELIRKKPGWKSGFYDLISSAAAVIAFVLTEDIFTPMCIVDKWTPLMAVILAACLVVYRMTVRGKKLDKELAEKILSTAANGGGKK